MKLPLSTTIVVLSLCVSTCYVHAWDNIGHEVVAQIAYDQLAHDDPAVTAKLDAIIRADPRPLRKDLLVCAIWPDLNKHRTEVKNPPQALFADAPIERDWHFVDIPYEETDPAEISRLIDLAGITPNPKHPKSSGNVVVAIRYYSALLKKSSRDPRGDARDRADYLSWIVHYVGDVHQPLHCVTVTESLRNYTPPERGDEGGNGFALTGLGRIKELHALWDDQLDLIDKERGRKEDNIHPDHAKIQGIASRLESEFPRTHFTQQLKKDNPRDWALESFSYRTNIYALSPDAKPSRHYMDFAKTTSEERIALAGYRLAAVLESALR